MYTSRLFTLFMAIALMAVIALTIHEALATSAVVQADRKYDQIVPVTGSTFKAQSVPDAAAQGVIDYIGAHSNPSVQAVPEAAVQSVTDYIRLHSDLSLREYDLGERYGDLP